MPRMPSNRFLDISRSPTLKVVKSKAFRDSISRTGSIADPILPGAKSAGLALAGKPGEAIANTGGVLGEVGYKTASQSLRTAKRFKGTTKQKAIAAARGARTGLRKSAKDIANNVSGGLGKSDRYLPEGEDGVAFWGLEVA